MANIQSNNDFTSNNLIISYCEHPCLKYPIPLKIIQGNVNDYLEKIKNGRWKDKIEVCHNLYLEYLKNPSKSNKKLYDKQKKKLPIITFSGIFENRFENDEKHLKEYTHWLILDIDPKDNPFIRTPQDVEEWKKKLSAEKFIYAIFISPSGYGLKILVRGNQQQHQHKEFFSQLERYLKEKYNITLCPSGSNINRFCYVSYDPNIYINPQTSIFELNHADPTNDNPSTSSKRTQYREDNEEILDNILAYLNETNQSITYEYDNWIKTGFALITEFHKNKQKAKNYFHQFSMLDENKYNTNECNERFNQLAENSKQRINIATIIYFAQQKGFKAEISDLSESLPLSIYLLKLLHYDKRFFRTIEEIVLFEFFCLKARSFKYKEFRYSGRLIERETRIRRTKQEKVIDFLSEHGILEVEIKGFPKQKHFKVNFEKVYELLPDIYNQTTKKEYK